MGTMNASGTSSDPFEGLEIFAVRCFRQPHGMSGLTKRMTPECRGARK
jgi:hypothetical protein